MCFPNPQTSPTPTPPTQWWKTIAAAKLPNFQHGRVLFPFPLLKLLPYRANLYRRTQVSQSIRPFPRPAPQHFGCCCR